MSLKSVTGTKGQHGLSLIEFMIAMLLGTILIGGAISIYLASSRSYTETEGAVSLGNSARFALQVMTDSLRHVGFMAGLEGQDVDHYASLDPLPSTENCSGPCDAYDLSNFLYAARYLPGAVTSPSMFDAIVDVKPGTDVLVVKYLLPEPLSDADPNGPTTARDGVIDFPSGLDSEKTYVVSNGEKGKLMDGADTPPNVTAGEDMAFGRAWPYQFQVYYVRDTNPPVLARKTLDGSSGSMVMVTEDLVEGVENLRFRFGFDTDVDGDIDTFRNLGMAADPTDPNWDFKTVGFVEVFVLVRSLDNDPNYADEKSYSMVDLVYTPSTDDPNSPSDPHPQEFSRLMVSSPITLRNRLFYLRGGQ
jgi:type IV pilus assembly protein PilW